MRSRLIRWTLLMLAGLEAGHSAAQPTDAKYLIIHADDAGMSHSVNRGTIDAMEQGVVSSASILVPCAWFPEFADYAQQHPDKDYGVHLTLTSEWEFYRWRPVAGADNVPSLVDADGYLWDNVAQVREAVQADEARVELRAQIDRARQFGIPLSHLDTHMGALFSRPDLLEIYVELGIQYDLPVLFIRELDPRLASEYPGLADRGPAMIARLADRRMPLLDQIGQFYGGNSHAERRSMYVEFLRGLQPGVSELIIHCGYDNQELQAITSSSSRRDGDRRIFMEPDIRKLLEELDIQVITWKELRKMDRK